jgi:hypothetical protein
LAESRRRGDLVTLAVRSVTAYDPGVRRALRRWGWRDWLVLAALAAVVGTSLLPWFGRTVDWSDGRGDRTMHFAVSAWAGSEQWTIALLLAVCAGLAWLTARSWGRFETTAGLLALALVAMGIWLTVHRWHSIPRAGKGPYKLVITVSHTGFAVPDHVVPPPNPTVDLVAEPHHIYAIHRDQLNIEHLRGYSADVRFGLYLGLVAMSLLALMLVAALATHRARADVGESG